MNAVLEEIGAKVGQEIQDIPQRLDFLHLLPTKAVPQSIIEAGEHDPPAKALANLLHKIICLEKKNEILNEKSREILGDLIVQALKLISSSPSLQTLLLESESATDGDGKDMALLKDYLSKVSNVGCRNISISHDQDKMNSSILFKTIEKCNTNLYPQKAKMEKALSERSAVLDRGQRETETLLKEIEKTLQETKAMAIHECGVDEEAIDAELIELAMKHEQNMNELQSELDLLHATLSETGQAHYHAEQELVGELHAIEDTKNKIQQQHCAEEKKRQGVIDKIEALIKIELSERRNLEDRCKLVEANREIEEKEEMLLKHVLDMEAKADSILFHGAMALQKLYRGNRDRSIVTKLKKKNQKKGNGKRKKGKGKK